MDERWIEIFRAGTHTDMSGDERTWTTQDLDEIVEKYDPKNHEAPIVVGHPKINAPAYGWIKALRRVGDVLEGLHDFIDPAFRDAVQAGYWKKRSVSFYPDKSLRHVGFLGATPPAVKGLEDVSFAAEEEAVTIDFATINEKEARTMPEELENELREKIAERDQKIQEFGEQISVLKGQLNGVATTLESERKGRREGTLADYCDKLVDGGHILPAERPETMELMQALDSGGEYDFADGGKSGPEALFKLLRKIPDRVYLGETATHNAARRSAHGKKSDFGESVNADRMEIHEKAVAYSTEKGVSYADAVIQVMEGEA